MMPQTPIDFLTLLQQYAWPFYRFEALRYLVVAGGLAAIIWLFRLRQSARRIQPRTPNRADYTREIFTSLRTAAIFGLVGMLTVWAQRNGHFPGHVPHPAVANTVLALAALLLWHDTWFYWTHRAMHDRRIFPWMHRTHHRSVAPTPFSAYAFSTSEAVVQAAFLPLWLAVIPTPLLATFLLLMFMIVRNVMGHAGVELHARGWVDHPVLQWINTTVHHDLHHSGRFGSNYGLYFTWWDRMMGTEHPEYRQRFRALTGDAPATDAVPQPGR